MIVQFAQKVKLFIREHANDLFVASVIFLVGLGGFGMGRLSALWPEKEPITVEKYDLQQEINFIGNTVAAPSKNVPTQAFVGRYVASKNGRVYHYPWCSGARNIKEENKVWFQTKEEAESRGYRPAVNCEGL